MTQTLSPLLRRPLLCLALLWAGGILLAAHHPIPYRYGLLAAVCCLLGWACMLRWTPGFSKAALLLATLALAVAVTGWRFAPPVPGDQRYLPLGGVQLRGYPLAMPQQTAYGWHTPFRLVSIRANARWHSARGTIYLTGRGLSPAPGHYYAVMAQVLPAEEALNPYGFSWRSYLLSHDLTYRVRTLALTPLPGSAPESPLASLRDRYRARLLAVMPRSYGHLHAQLLEGLIFGLYGSPMPEQISEQFRRAGTIHLMVVSGSQVALLGGLFLLPLGLLPAGRARTSYPRLRLALLFLSLALLGCYTLLADRGPSVDRALLMVLITSLSLFAATSPLARYRSFRPDGLTLWGAAGLILLLANPGLLFHPGFQLSFAAVFGLLTIAPVLLRLWHRWPKVVAFPLAATLGAQAMTYPVLAWHFGTVPLLAPLTNLIAVPIAGVLLPLGLITILFAYLAPIVAIAINAINLRLLYVLLMSGTLASAIPWSQVACYTRSSLGVIAYLSFLALATRFLSRWIDRRVQGWDVPGGREPRMW